MNNPFQVEDKVYHPEHGEGVVKKPEIEWQERRDWVTVVFPRIGCLPVDACMLSFSPWPKPDHVRPRVDGLYAVLLNRDVALMYSRKGEWFTIGRNLLPHHKFDGELTTLQFFG